MLVKNPTSNWTLSKCILLQAETPLQIFLFYDSSAVGIENILLSTHQSGKESPSEAGCESRLQIF